MSNKHQFRYSGFNVKSFKLYRSVFSAVFMLMLTARILAQDEEFDICGDIEKGNAHKYNIPQINECTNSECVMQLGHFVLHDIKLPCKTNVSLK